LAPPRNARLTFREDAGFVYQSFMIFIVATEAQVRMAKKIRQEKVKWLKRRIIKE
jgi:hypothetical protein